MNKNKLIKYTAIVMVFSSCEMDVFEMYGIEVINKCKFEKLKEHYSYYYALDLDEFFIGNNYFNQSYENNNNIMYLYVDNNTCMHTDNDNIINKHDNIKHIKFCGNILINDEIGTIDNIGNFYDIKYELM